MRLIRRSSPGIKDDELATIEVAVRISTRRGKWEGDTVLVIPGGTQQGLRRIQPVAGGEARILVERAMRAALAPKEESP